MADELQDVVAIVVLSPSDYELRVRYWDDFFPEREALDLLEQFCDFTSQFYHLKAQYWEANFQRSTTSLRSQALTTETIPLLLHSTPDLLIDFIGRADVIGKLPRTV
ncbi:hypothetical protein BDV35DRAFT_395918 [Aspergillus flavus]|uniref:Uncharacterized protein n=1 Tax=Aspergillus flavus TaxID=5059 RepID=A0A364M404_ASPFL|nr:hypothetical protein BDV35DRAFT_395918 [Aspergillus flavus]QMW45550.1 hypothetical protein G4B11_009005 [Aspergillus flavus]RAQ61702.1 hypothetical protein COH20_010244 [Aspergillus flavus]RAQ68736.1 hypothetical protein COH21_012220 [Aspergillus flavus]RMZ42240.1 hypothetical protein CA14_003083 [Aspergillus flavus]